ncbi:hypothetical protein [Parapedobacter tibetensis]|uniref:hypothetical protein n=1 Tax=Parapedobacter tibetensis TaxID=2972951 RepID=UPI00214D877C|nr:hypothetical protein [Parapedobacter tibetensis]
MLKINKEFGYAISTADAGNGRADLRGEAHGRFARDDVISDRFFTAMKANN